MTGDTREAKLRDAVKFWKDWHGELVVALGLDHNEVSATKAAVVGLVSERDRLAAELAEARAKLAKAIDALWNVDPIRAEKMQREWRERNGGGDE